MELIGDIAERVLANLTKEAEAMVWKTPNDVLDQLEEVRESGSCNMCSKSSVQQVALEMDLRELECWIDEADTVAFGIALNEMGARRTSVRKEAG